MDNVKLDFCNFAPVPASRVPWVGTWPARAGSAPLRGGRLSKELLGPLFTPFYFLICACLIKPFWLVFYCQLLTFFLQVCAEFWAGFWARVGDVLWPLWAKGWSGVEFCFLS